MSRETSPYIVGRYWLDKRRDGASPDVWQIAGYAGKDRRVWYKSTRCRSLDEAQAVIDAYHAREVARGPQRPDEALVVPMLMLYWEEKGSNAIKPAQIASSLRQFIAFLDQDTATIEATLAALDKQLFERFRLWRASPHSYEIGWQGKTYRHTSKGVVGESVQRNLDDVRSAINHAVNSNRIPFVPKVPSVADQHRSGPRERTLTAAERGSIFWYAIHQKPMFRRVALMLGTAVRPEAAMAFNPLAQYFPEEGVIDLHPVGHPRTKKVNPVVPVIPELRPVLDEWRAELVALQASDADWRFSYPKEVKTAWRTMRRVLGLSGDVIQKTIRHTVASRLYALRRQFPTLAVEEIEILLGHRPMKKTTSRYVKFDPDYLASLIEPLSTIWSETIRAADAFGAVHSLSKIGNGETRLIDFQPEKEEKSA